MRYGRSKARSQGWRRRLAPSRLGNAFRPGASLGDCSQYGGKRGVPNDKSGEFPVRAEFVFLSVCGFEVDFAEDGIA